MKNGIVAMSSNKEKRVLRRGDIYFANLCGIEDSIGSEQTGRRPVLIIQNDVGNKYSPTTIVAILTTKIKNNLPTHVVIDNFAGLSQTSVVCLEQIKTIDKSRLENYCGNIGTQLMKEIDKAMRVSLGTMENVSYEQMIAAVKEVDNMELVKKDTYFDNQHYDWIQVAKEQMRRLYQSALSKMQQGESEKRRTAVVQQLLEQEVS